MIYFKIDFTYENEVNKALNEVCGVIQMGKCIVLCGNSGCGKSTLIRTVNRLIPYFYEGKIDGYCKVAGNDLDALSIGEVGKIVSSVFQDPRSQFFTMNSCTELAFALENFGVNPVEIRERVEEAFSVFSLENLKNRNVFELSSGERQLIAILCMWVIDNDICILDEPTANLDFNAIEELTKALKILKSQGKTIVVNEHRLYYLADIADEYWRMENGTIVQKYTREVMNNLAVSELNDIGLRTNSLEKLNIETSSARSISDSKVSIKDIHCKYKKSKSKILNGFSYEANFGDVVAIVGGNGCGKTTLGKIISGLMQMQSGTVCLNDVKLKSKEQVDSSIFIMQETEFQFFTNTVYKELTYGKTETDELKTKIEKQLKKFGMWHLKDRHPFALSGGQMQKLSLLIAYFSDKNIVVLDEPTAGLDYNSLKNCIDLLKEMRKNKVIFVITHDLEFISKSCNKSVYIKNGRNQKEFLLDNEGSFDELRKLLETDLKDVMNNSNENVKETRLLDPRIKFAVMFSALIVETLAITQIIMTFFAFSMLIGLYERRYKIVAIWVLLLGFFTVLPYALPCAFTMFLSQLFPRFITLGAALSVTTVNDGASKLIAGLRKLRVHEKIIMVASVIFRFFPVLVNDLKIMRQAIRTRSIRTNGLKNLPFLLEIMIVPLTFRVIKIAEVLSASAQTRGIDLSNKRTSYIEVKFKKVDYFASALAMLLLVASIIALI